MQHGMVMRRNDTASHYHGSALPPMQLLHEVWKQVTVPCCHGADSHDMHPRGDRLFCYFSRRREEWPQYDVESQVGK